MHQKNVDLGLQLSPPVLTKSPTRSYGRSRGSSRLAPPFFRGARPERVSEVSEVSANSESDVAEAAAELAADFEAPAFPDTHTLFEPDEVAGSDEISERFDEPTGFEPPPGFERDIAAGWAPAPERYDGPITAEPEVAEPEAPAGSTDSTAAPAAEGDAGGAWDLYRLADPEPSSFSVDQPDASLWALEFGAVAREHEQQPEHEQPAAHQQPAASDADVGGDADEASALAGLELVDDAEVNPDRPDPVEAHELAQRVAMQLDELADELRENGMAALSRRSDTGELARLLAAVIAGFHSREHE